MILFDLKCDVEHRFEAWFRDGASFDSQRRSRKVQCPVCGSSAVDKALMAPKLVRGEVRHEPEPEPPRAPKDRAPVPSVKVLRALREHIEKNSDDVGERFADEARKVHYGEVEPRNIHGRASDQESHELREEGIEFGQIPWISRHDS